MNIIKLLPFDQQSNSQEYVQGSGFQIPPFPGLKIIDYSDLMIELLPMETREKLSQVFEKLVQIVKEKRGGLNDRG